MTDVFAPGFAYQPGDSFLGGTVISAAKFYPRLGTQTDAPFTHTEAGPADARYDTGRHLLLVSYDGHYHATADEWQFSYTREPRSRFSHPLPRPLAEAEHRRAVARYDADPRWQRA